MARLYRHELALKIAYSWALGKNTKKQGFYLVLETPDAYGVGEFSPAPNQEVNWAKVEQEFHQVIQTINLDSDNLCNDIDLQNVNPRIRCAVVSAWACLKAARQGCSLAQELGKNFRKPALTVPINGVLPICDLNQSILIVRNLVAQGISTLKVKCANDLKQLELLLQSVRELFPQLKLRLDPNGIWSSNTLSIIESLAKYEIEYVEQPLAETTSIKEFATLRKSSAIPIALDQSVSNLESVYSILEERAADRLILKSQRLGGPDKVIEIIKICEKAAMPLTVTASLESLVGISRSIALAALLKEPISPCGVHLWPFFENSPGVAPLVKQGQVEVKDILIAN